MNLEKLKDAARKHEQKEDWRRAIEVYQKAIQEFESGHDPNPDLSIYNRVGDLYMKANDPTAAVQAYERAVDLYSEQGFLNNAIALCGKILRLNPGRIQIYLKLAQLHARKNVVIEAKKNLLEYLERMNGMNQLNDAFRAVRAFADQFPGNEEIRHMLSELLRASSRSTEAREQIEKITADLESTGESAGPRKTRATQATGRPGRKGDLVFLDIGMEVSPAEPEPEPAAPAPPRRSTIRVPRPTVRTTPVMPESIPEEAGETDAGEDDLAIEQTRLTDGSLELESVSTEESGLDVLRADDAILPAEPLEIEPTIVEGVEVEAEPVDGLELDARAEDLTLDDSSVAEMRSGLGLEEVEVEPEPPAEEMEIEYTSISDAAGELGAGIEEAEIEPDPDFVPLENLVEEETPLPLIQPETEVEPEYVGVEEAGLGQAADAGTETGVAPGPSIEELEDLVLDDPDNPETHRALGEALIASGELTRGLDELDLALLAFENQEDWQHALDLVNELIRVDPLTVRYYQKRVEVAYRTGDRLRLIDAYLELGDALVRTGALEKAMAVYRRVLEHEPDNSRAASALQAFAPPAEEEPPGAGAAAPPPAVPGRASGTAARETVEAAAESGDFIDLGSLILDEPLRDTRMRVEDEEPTGDEEKDFKEMLQQFKRGIEQNLDAEDFQSHYDLGVAFKEMGLLDEAIAEFQKALRAPEGRLRTSEALGTCFYEKEQFAIAEAILRRAVDALPGSDDQKVGLLYWLARAFEAQQKNPEAVDCYRRVLAVDIRFSDAGPRMNQLNTAGMGS